MAKKNMKTVKTVSKSGKIYYRKKSRKSAVLVDKAGKVRQKAVNALKEKIMKRDDLTAAEKRMLTRDLDARVFQAKGKSRDHSMTENSFFGAQEENEKDRMLANMGYSEEMLAEELGVSQEAMENAEWDFKNNTLKVNGEEYGFTFNYVGSAFTKK